MVGRLVNIISTELIIEYCNRLSSSRLCILTIYSYSLSGPIRAKRFAIRIRIANILCDSHFVKKNVFFFLRIRPLQKMDNSKERTRIPRISRRIGEKTRFARIWPSASKIVFFLKTSAKRGSRWVCEPLAHLQLHYLFKLTHWPDRGQSLRRGKDNPTIASR